MIEKVLRCTCHATKNLPPDLMYTTMKSLKYEIENLPTNNSICQGKFVEFKSLLGQTDVKNKSNNSRVCNYNFVNFDKLFVLLYLERAFSTHKISNFRIIFQISRYNLLRNSFLQLPTEVEMASNKHLIIPSL